MGEDARNSVNLWLGALVIGGLFLAESNFQIFQMVSDDWKQGFATAGLLVFAGHLVRWTWRKWLRGPEASKRQSP